MVFIRSTLPLKAYLDKPAVTRSEIKDIREAFGVHNRKGRGHGSGRGKRSGRGNKGQGQHNTKMQLGFNGERTRWWMRWPKMVVQPEIAPEKRVKFGLDKLQYYIDIGILNASAPINLRTLYGAGVLGTKSNFHTFELTDEGKEVFKAKVSLCVTHSTPEAIEVVERLGGRIVTKFMTPEMIESQLYPRHFLVAPPPAFPRSQKDIEYYTNWANRGYLSISPSEIAAKALEPTLD